MLNQINFLLIDAARMEGKMDEAIAMNPAHDSLYRGGSEESLSSVAPYLFKFEYESEFGSWFMENGWGDSWGVMINSSYPMPELHKHFRKFLLVKTEEGAELYFRFYDPRVLRTFLPTCDLQQLREFFGPVAYFICEDEDPAYALLFSFREGLQTKRSSKEELVGLQISQSQTL